MRVPSNVRRVVVAIALAGTALAPVQAQRRPQAAPVTAVSQVPPPATALETLITRPNTLVSLDLYRVTNDGLSQSFGLAIDAVVAAEVPAGAAPLQGLRVEVSEPGPPARSRVSYVDAGELAGLSQALSQMKARGAAWTAQEPTRASDAHYATEGGFVVGIRETNRSQTVYVSAGLVDPTRRTTDAGALDVIKTAVDDAIALLKR